MEFRFFRQYINTVIILLGVIFASVFLWYRQREKTAAAKENAPPTPDFTDNGSTIPKDKDSNGQLEYKKVAIQLSEDLFKAIDGLFTAASTKEIAFRQLYRLTDNQLKYVYAVYNELFFSRTQEDMTEAIDNEINVTLGGVRDALVTRLKSLGCYRKLSKV